MAEKQDNIATNLELKNTTKIDGNFYNINAVHSDIAEKVANALTIKKSGEKICDFDGSAPGCEIDYIPATGGTFSGSVHLGNPTKNPENSELITYGQINNLVTDLNGSPVCVWDTSLTTDNLDQSLYSLIDKDTDKLYKFTTITGTESDFYVLKSVIDGNAYSSPELTYKFYYNSLSPILNCWQTDKVSDNAIGIIIIKSTHTGVYSGKEYTEKCQRNKQ